MKFLAGPGKVWPVISNLKGRNRIAAIAYLGDGAPDLLPQFTDGDVIICDASESAIRNGATSVTVLSAFRSRGVSLYSMQGLHAKVVCVGPTAVIGSMNASQASAGKQEVAVCTTDPKIVGEARSFARGLIRESTFVDDSLLRWAKTVPVRRGSGSTKTVRSSGDVVTFESVVREEPPLFLQRAIEAFEANGSLKAGFKLHQSWGNPHEQRQHRVGDLVVWLYRKDGRANAPAVSVDVGRIIAVEKVRTRWLYHEITPTKPPKVTEQELRTRLVGLGFRGKANELGDGVRRVRLEGLQENLEDLFGTSFPSWI